MLPSSGFNVYLLAAGRGQRAGGPKAWIRHEGRGLLQRQMDFLSGRFRAKNIYVTIQKEWEARCADMCDASVWVSENPEASVLHALQALIRASGAKHPSYLYHVDMPVWHADIFDALSAEDFFQKGADAAVPIFKARAGHPVLLSCRAQKDILKLDENTHRLDHWLRSRKVVRVDVRNGAVLENWNKGSVAA